MSTKVTTELKEKVEAKLRRDPRLKDYPVEVLDHGGIIILQGDVPSEAISMIIEGLVRQVEGVVSVSNELYIKSL